ERIGSFAIPHLLVPQADMRVLLFNNDTDLNTVFDAEGMMGVTNVVLAVAIVLFTLAAAFACLWLTCRKRFPGVRKPPPLLCLITTRGGFASLSQFQIMLWTFVVIASVVYVIALSGDLIPITSGTLVLLGISGTATIIAKAKSEGDAPPASLDPAAAKAEVARADDEA